MKLNSVLAIDSSSNRLKIGLLTNGDRIVKLDEQVEQSHSEMIIEKIDAVINSSGIQKNELDAMIVALGPGSFTGLRIGIAASKGIASALHIPIVGINHFQIAAYKLRDESDDIFVIVPFKKEHFFVVPVNSGSYFLDRVGEMNLEELSDFCKNKKFALIGLSRQFTSELDNDYSSKIVYDASDLLELGVLKLNSKEIDDLANLEPLYIQKSQAEINFELKNKK